MKKVFSLIALVVVINSAIAQSGTDIITVQIQVRDLEYMKEKTKLQRNWFHLDSALIVKTDSILAQPNQFAITIAGVQARQWRSFMGYLRGDLVAIHGNTYSRVDAALRALNHSWLNNRMDEDFTLFTAQWTDGRQEGRKSYRKEVDLQ